MVLESSSFLESIPGHSGGNSSPLFLGRGGLPPFCVFAFFGGPWWQFLVFGARVQLCSNGEGFPSFSFSLEGGGPCAKTSRNKRADFSV